MKQYIFWCAAAICGGAFSSCAGAQNTRIEAEANPPSGSIQIIEDADASGGKAVSIDREYQPLFKAPIPANGDEFTIWARYQNGAIQAKSRVGGKQVDLKWSYGKPKTLTWKSLGRYGRAQLGEELIIIRGNGASAILDAVVFATDEKYNPNSDATDAATGAVAAVGGAAPNQDDANMGEEAQVALGLKNTPVGDFFEAEHYSNADVVEAEGASNGKAVTSKRDYQSLVAVPLPIGEAWKIWVRYQSGPFAIKTKTDGKDIDRWKFSKAKNFKWAELDVFSREDLGGNTLNIGRGAGDGKDVLVDAVVLQSAVKRELPADKPDANLAPVQVAASVDWSAKTGVISPMMWGINEHEVITAKTPNAAFQEKLGALGAPIIRVHNANVMDAWTNEKTRDWDVAKIKENFAGSTGYGDTPIMMNLTWAPKWMGGKTRLNEEQEDELAALWARLVVVMRDDIKRPVAYWEITNELENIYEKAEKLDDLWRFYNKCALAMRKQDPKAKLGGMAFTWPKPQWIEGFLQNCPDVQFVSWHNYGTGDLYQSNAEIFQKVNSNIGKNARAAMKLVKQFDKGRNLETFLSETNVKYTWDPYERRHQNAVGSVFHALVVKEMAQTGLTGTMLWQQRGQPYGSLLDNQNKTFPSYQLYQWGPQYLSGAIVTATSGDEELLELLPVISHGGRKAVLLINKAPRALQIGAASKLLPDVKSAQRIDTSGYNTKIEIGNLELPGYSLTLLLD